MHVLNGVYFGQPKIKKGIAFLFWSFITLVSLIFQVCSVHFIDRKPTREHPYPVLLLGHQEKVYYEFVHFTRSPCKNNFFYKLIYQYII